MLHYILHPIQLKLIHENDLPVGILAAKIVILLVELPGGRVENPGFYHRTMNNGSSVIIHFFKNGMIIFL